jgi:hypothetical protein
MLGRLSNPIDSPRTAASVLAHRGVVLRQPSSECGSSPTHRRRTQRRAGASRPHAAARSACITGVGHHRRNRWAISIGMSGPLPSESATTWRSVGPGAQWRPDLRVETQSTAGRPSSRSGSGCPARGKGPSRKEVVYGGCIEGVGSEPCLLIARAAARAYGPIRPSWMTTSSIAKSKFRPL